MINLMDKASLAGPMETGSEVVSNKDKWWEMVLTTLLTESKKMVSGWKTAELSGKMMIEQNITNNECNSMIILFLDFFDNKY